jgi:hypothetical protein
MRHHSVPAFLSIDVEPDRFQLTANEPPAWRGFEAMIVFAASLREAIAARSGRPPQFGWYFRTDPQIESAYGRPDHALRHYGDHIRRVRAAGDYLGVHVHPIRWNEEHRSWVHDVADVGWLDGSIRSSCAVFAEWAGSPSPYSRYGAGFLNNDVLAAIEASGVTIDLTLEPVTSWATRVHAVPTTVDASPIVGAYVDCSGAPREPYVPSREDFRRRASVGSRPLTLVPLSTAVFRRRFFSPAAVHVLYPSLPWLSERYFWDLAMKQLETMDRPFLSLAIRTDAHDMALTARVRRLFAALPGHPIAERLHWVDPRGVVAGLVETAD